MKYTYTLENLNCAHCAGKIEQKIASTEGYNSVNFNFATKALNFYSDKNNTLTEIQNICDSIEDGVHVVDSAVIKDSDKKGLRAENILLIIAIVFGAAAAVIHFTASGNIADYTVLGLSLAATLLAGYKVFIKGFRNLIKFNIEETVLMSIAVIAAFILGEYIEGAMVTLLFTIGELIEDRAVDSSRRDIEKLSQIRPDTATIICNGREEEVPAESVKIGSTVLIKPHQRIPLDGIVLKGSSSIDNSALTGESIPVTVSEGSEVLSGGINGDSLIKIRTTKIFGDSTAARILKMVEDAAAQKGSREKFISRFASVYTPIVIGLAVLIALLPPILGFGSFSEWIYNALVVLVASCPCAIVISVPLAYYSGIGAASKHGMLIKGGKYLETLASADTFVFDKTGTLTTGILNVRNIYSFSNYSEAEILSLASAIEKYSSHPIAAAIRKKANNYSDYRLTDFNETAGHGISAMFKGKKIICGSSKIVPQAIPEEAGNCNVFLVYGDELIGAIEVSDTVRNESREVIGELKKLGISKTVMLTGDSRANSEAVFAQTGVSDYKAQLMPEDKLREVNALKHGKKPVCFVGDGINDAPVLSASDCGIAMGLGSEAAIEASDAVLSSGTLHNLPKAIRIARKTVNRVRTNIIFALLVKAAVIILACFGLAAIWMSVLADTGVCVVCVLYTAQLLKCDVSSKPRTKR